MGGISCSTNHLANLKDFFSTQFMAGFIGGSSPDLIWGTFPSTSYASSPALGAEVWAT